MKKPRRPRDLRNLKLTTHEYQIIGEIVVLSGLIEQFLKDIPLMLLGAKHESSRAFTAHLNARSLCDLNLTLIPEYVTDADDREFLEKDIKAVASLFDDRNRIVHGPFAYHAGRKGTIRVTARQRIQWQAHEYGQEKLTHILSDLIDSYEGLSLFVMLKKIEAFAQARDHNSPRSHKAP